MGGSMRFGTEIFDTQISRCQTALTRPPRVVYRLIHFKAMVYMIYMYAIIDDVIHVITVLVGNSCCSRSYFVSCLIVFIGRSWELRTTSIDGGGCRNPWRQTTCKKKRSTLSLKSRRRIVAVDERRVEEAKKPIIPKNTEKATAWAFRLFN